MKAKQWFAVGSSTRHVDSFIGDIVRQPPRDKQAESETIESESMPRILKEL